jgi:hypothetical protein
MTVVRSMEAAPRRAEWAPTATARLSGAAGGSGLEGTV